MSKETFLAELFEFEYCHECGGDGVHHDVLTDVPFPGTFFARCRFEPGEDGTHHPVVAAYRDGE